MIETFIKKTEETKAAYVAAVESDSIRAKDEAATENKAALVELAAAVTKGASPCPSCGAHPHGMVQCWDIEKEEVVGFEIGCPLCPGHQAVGYMAADRDARRDLAVANWNAGPAKWWKAKGDVLELVQSGTEVVLALRRDPGRFVSCLVVLPASSELETEARTVAAGKFDTEASRKEAIALNYEASLDLVRSDAFKKAVRERNNNVNAFREKHGAGSARFATLG